MNLYNLGLIGDKEIIKVWNTNDEVIYEPGRYEFFLQDEELYDRHKDCKIILIDATYDKKSSRTVLNFLIAM